MLRIVLVRLVWGVATLWVASVLVFGGTELLTGDPASAVLGRDATPSALAALRKQLDLNEPAPRRYLRWLTGIVHGDLGRSLTIGTATGEGGVPVSQLIGSRIDNSALLAGLATLVTVPLAIMLGVVSALRPGKLVDSIISTTTLAFIALPEFVVGTTLVLLFAIIWPLFPAVSLVSSTANVGARTAELVLPVATLAAASVAQMSRLVRGSMIEALESPHVQMARLRGLSAKRVILRYALRTALVPTIQVIALTVAWFAGGIVVVEVVFNYPGVGGALTSAISARDLPVVQALALTIAGVFIVVNLLADVATILLTPKLRTRF
jgi:peptide/nickel transport system permease protein